MGPKNHYIGPRLLVPDRKDTFQRDVVTYLTWRMCPPSAARVDADTTVMRPLATLLWSLDVIIITIVRGGLKEFFKRTDPEVFHAYSALQDVTFH